MTCLFRACSYLSLFILIALTACKEETSVSSGVVASVHDVSMTVNMLQDKMPASYQPEDSAQIADQIIMAWVREQALLKMAEQNLSEEQKNVQDQLDTYRNSLIVYAYERAIVEQKLDTIVSDEELSAYYDANSDNFRLKRFIVKASFVKLSQDAPRQRDVEKWLKSGDEEDLDLLYDYARKYAENFYLNSGLWLYIEDLSKEVPLPLSDLADFLKNTQFVILEQDGFKYYVSIHEFRLRGDLAPLALVRSSIRDLILNRRKAELIARTREDVVGKGISSGNIKIYTQ